MIKRIVLIICFCIGVYPFSYSQDSIPAAKDLNEEKNLRFQEFFFKALSDKAIRNYQKAIGNLEVCNEILPNNPTVYFEISKNYFLLKRDQLAKEYITRALEKKPDDVWMQLHLIKILKKSRDYKEAIKIQKKLAVTNSKRKEELVYLYLQDRDYTNAIALMNSLEAVKGISKRMKQLKSSLEARKSSLLKKEKKNDLTSLITRFDKNSSLKDLILILEKTQLSNQELFFKYSSKGLDLFPAQPAVYLYNAKALFQQKSYKKALAILETGIDFVIDNNTMTKLFYEEMGNNYKALGNQEKFLEMKTKVKQLKI